MRVRSRVVISPLFLAGLLSCVGATETPATSEAPDEDDGTSTSGTTDDSNSASSSSTTTPTTDSTTGPEASTATSSTGDETIGSSTSGTALECGDGVVDPETEECDDGPENSDHGACTGQCVLNVCGDGLLHDGVEECDLGPANNDGAQCGGCMSETCTLGPHCGDGHVDVACGELCDGGDTPDGLSCSPTCRFEGAKLVFITPGYYGADLTSYTERPVHDGIDAADWICHDLADAAGLIVPPGENDEPIEPRFRAWIGGAGKDENDEPIEIEDDYKSVLNRFNTTHSGLYLTRDGTTIAEGWSGLVSGELLEPITATSELNEYRINKLVWTNTRPDGSLNQPFLSCFDWTFIGGLEGAIGFNADPSLWTFIQGEDGLWSCEASAHLYCVEQ